MVPFNDDIGLQETLAHFNANLPLEEAFTPPASWYISDRILELEKVTTFSTSWLFVGRAAQVRHSGDYFTGSFLGRPFVVTRDEQGQLRAFYNVCSHHAACVAKGAGTVQKLACPYHGWTYSLSGQLTSAPKAGDIKKQMAVGLDLKPIPVKSWGPFILLRFSEQGLDLEEQLEGLTIEFPKEAFDNLRFICRKTYEIHCNWKVFIDNYLDGGYHVPYMHKGLSAQLNLKTYHTVMGNRWSVQACSASSGSGIDQDLDFGERLGERALYAWIYPHFMLNRYGRWMDANTVIPLDSDRCLILFDYFYDGDISEDELNRALTASDRVQQEDTEICKMVQTGLHSGAYKQGIYAPRFEAPMHHFHQLLSRDLHSKDP